MKPRNALTLSAGQTMGAGLAVLAAFALAFALACGMALVAAQPAYAADGKITYKVRVWGGNVGTVDGGAYGEVEVEEGANVTPDKLFTYGITDSKYYKVGIRIGGEDNQQKVGTSSKVSGTSNLVGSVQVNEDMDFVVAYGVRGKMVNYTLRFVEQGTNRELADPITYEGKIGDKPVAAFEYVSGYRPLYRNITKTLVDGENEFVFEYVRLGAGETEDGRGGTQQAATTTTQQGSQAAQNPQGSQGTQNPQASQGAQNPQQGSAASQPAAEPEPNPPATEEILDEDVALSSGTEGDDSADGAAGFSLPMPAIVGIVLALVVAIGALAGVFLKRRGDRELENY